MQLFGDVRSRVVDQVPAALVRSDSEARVVGDFDQHRAEQRRVDRQVDEAGSGDLRHGDSVEIGGGDDVDSDLAGIPPESLGEGQRSVRLRISAVRGPDDGVDVGLAGDGGKRRRQAFGQHCEEVGHGPTIVARSGVERLRDRRVDHRAIDNDRVGLDDQRVRLAPGSLAGLLQQIGLPFQLVDLLLDSEGELRQVLTLDVQLRTTAIDPCRPLAQLGAVERCLARPSLGASDEAARSPSAFTRAVTRASLGVATLLGRYRRRSPIPWSLGGRWRPVIDQCSY